MATREDATAGEVVGGRLRRTALLHLAAAMVFGLVASSGAAVIIDRAGVPGARAVTGFGVPYLVGGAAGMIGSLAIVSAAVLLGRRLAGIESVASAGRSAVRAEDAARVFMAVAAIAVVAVGYPLAPTGLDRGFVFVVNGILAVALALFALLTGDLRRAVRLSPPSVQGHPARSDDCS